MNPINLTLNVPLSGNCDDISCCLPKRHSAKRKSQKEQKVQDVANKTLESSVTEKTI